MPKEEKKNMAPDADDNEEIISFLQADMNRAPEPGDMTPGTIVNTGQSEEAPFPSVISSVESAGYVTIYNRLTGDPSIANINNLRDKLRQRYSPDDLHAGELVFTLRDPGFRPPKGTELCWLHADHPRRTEFDKYGFAVCPAGNLQSEYQRDRHAEKRHNTEFAIIKDMINREKETQRDDIEAQDREERRKLLEILANRG